MRERIQKALARAGVASRREADRWVTEGRVTVNGQPAIPGQQVVPGDRIALPGGGVEVPPLGPTIRCLVYHKPAGELCTRRDPQDRPTIFDRLPEPKGRRWIAVGRLDLNSTGLLLVTDDGHLAHALMHPSRGLEREYRVRVRGTPSDATLAQLQRGIELTDGLARFAEARRIASRSHNATLQVVLREGRKREVRRLLEAVGHPVSRLRRTRFGPIGLPRDLPPGQWQALSADQVAVLRAASGKEEGSGR